MKIFFFSIGIGLVALWLFGLLSLTSGVWRRMQRAEQRHSLPPVRFVDFLRSEGLGLLGGSVAMTINVIVFAVCLAWYRLLGKPLPPAPRPPSSSRPRP